MAITIYSFIILAIEGIEKHTLVSYLTQTSDKVTGA